MRSHAKASSAGSTKRQASRLSRTFRGAMATVFALLALMVVAIPASAVEVWIAPVFFGTSGSGDGQLALTEHSGVAVNETTHDVYVADTGNHRVDQFDSSGNFIGAFGADVGGTGVNACTTDCAIGTSGSAPGAFEAPTFIAVDNSASAAEGDVYVADASTNVVSRFHADGSLDSSWATGGQLAGKSPETFGEIVGIAVGASGSLFVLRGGNPGLMFQFAANGTFGTEFATPRGSAPAGLGVDPSGDFFKVNGVFSVEKFDATGTDIGQVSNTASAKGLAVDPSSGELFIDNGGSIDRYAFEPSGEVIGSGCTPAEFAGCAPSETFGSGDLTAGAGLAVDGASETVYAADFGASQIVGFLDVFLPVAVTEAATGADKDSAILHGTISADGGPEADCEFQYTTEAAFESEGFKGATGTPCSPAGPFTGSSSEPVSAEVAGLAFSTEYRFRIVASNENGANPGEALGFRTSGPVIGSQSVESTGLSDATVSAKINPKGEPTTYHVEYGTTLSYGQSTPESLPIGFEGDDSEHTVSVHIGGLLSGTGYHFRFIATSPEGSLKGADKTFATYPSTPTFEPCSNDRFRTGLGALLSDCRAYEQATPIDKHGANIQGSINSVQAASAGNRITFYLGGGLPTSGGSSTLSAFMASRGPTGWSSDGLLPATDPGFEARVMGWSDDLSTTVATSTGNMGGVVYLRDSDIGSYQLVSTGGGGFLAGFATDTSHFIYESAEALAPGAVSGQPNLYDVNHGAVTLVGRIPSGSVTSCDDVGGPSCIPAPDGSFAGSYNVGGGGCGVPNAGGATCQYYTQNTLSRDGSRVIFTAANSAQIYIREDGTKTTRVSASQRTTPDPNGEKPAAFMAATPDGSKVLFTSCEKLTNDSTAVSTAADECATLSQGQDLYSYDTSSGELTDLTTDFNPNDLKGAGVQGVLGATDDGSYVYFAANGVLAAGAASAKCDASLICSTRNLYVSHNGVTKFIAQVGAGADSEDWRARLATADQRNSRIAADGTLLFSSSQSLTGYDNAAPAGACGLGKAGEPCSELFRYRPSSDELTCVSCSPSGPPSGEAVLGTNRIFFHDPPLTTFLTRNLSADGNRVFFDSHDALVAADTNGVKDPYEWEADGSGSCHTEGGCLYLLSSGTSPDPSYLGDASANGDHAFIFTDQQLLPTDQDQLYDVYDAGVGAGLASQHALTPPTCSGVACQANPAPPPDPSLASAAFQGPGNARKPQAARKCPKGKRKVRRAGKVSCQRARKQHKRHSNRGGSK